MSRHIRLWLQFDGTAYHGWQVQANGVTVSQTVQDAIEAVCGRREALKGCSRTDAGVHALRYAASFFTESAIACQKLPLALNAHLPADIRVLSAEQVEEDFHPRYQAKSKTYLYRYWNSPVASAFEQERYAWRVNAPLDHAAMDHACRLFEGEHDFAGFMSAGSAIALSGGSTRRHVYRARVERAGSELRFFVTANGYLYNMVRIMAGTLAQVGTGKMDAAGVQAALDQAQRSLAGPTAPAGGLFLFGVEY